MEIVGLSYMLLMENINQGCELSLDKDWCMLEKIVFIVDH